MSNSKPTVQGPSPYIKITLHEQLCGGLFTTYKCHFPTRIILVRVLRLDYNIKREVLTKKHIKVKEQIKVKKQQKQLSIISIGSNRTRIDALTMNKTHSSPQLMHNKSMQQLNILINNPTVNHRQASVQFLPSSESNLPIVNQSRQIELMRKDINDPEQKDLKRQIWVLGLYKLLHQEGIGIDVSPPDFIRGVDAILFDNCLLYFKSSSFAIDMYSKRASEGGKFKVYQKRCYEMMDKLQQLKVGHLNIKKESLKVVVNGERSDIVFDDLSNAYVEDPSNPYLTLTNDNKSSSRQRNNKQSDKNKQPRTLYETDREKMQAFLAQLKRTFKGGSYNVSDDGSIISQQLQQKFYPEELILAFAYAKAYSSDDKGLDCFNNTIKFYKSFHDPAKVFQLLDDYTKQFERLRNLERMFHIQGREEERIQVLNQLLCFKDPYGSKVYDALNSDWIHMHIAEAYLKMQNYKAAEAAEKEISSLNEKFKDEIECRRLLANKRYEDCHDLLMQLLPEEQTDQKQLTSSIASLLNIQGLLYREISKLQKAGRIWHKALSVCIQKIDKIIKKEQQERLKEEDFVKKYSYLSVNSEVEAIRARQNFQATILSVDERNKLVESRQNLERCRDTILSNLLGLALETGDFEAYDILSCQYRHLIDECIQRNSALSYTLCYNDTLMLLRKGDYDKVRQSVSRCQQILQENKWIPLQQSKNDKLALIDKILRDMFKVGEKDHNMPNVEDCMFQSSPDDHQQESSEVNLETESANLVMHKDYYSKDVESKSTVINQLEMVQFRKRLALLRHGQSVQGRGIIEKCAKYLEFNLEGTARHEAVIFQILKIYYGLNKSIEGAEAEPSDQTRWPTPLRVCYEYICAHCSAQDDQASLVHLENCFSLLCKLVESSHPLVNKLKSELNQMYEKLELTDKIKQAYQLMVKQGTLQTDNASQHITVGRIYMQEGLFDLALKSYTRAQKTDSDNWELVLDLAECYEYLDDLANSLYYYSRCKEKYSKQLDSISYDIDYKLAELHLKAKENNKALLQLEQSVINHPEHYYTLAKLKLTLKKGLKQSQILNDSLIPYAKYLHEHSMVDYRLHQLLAIIFSKNKVSGKQSQIASLQKTIELLDPSDPQQQDLLKKHTLKLVDILISQSEFDKATCILTTFKQSYGQKELLKKQIEKRVLQCNIRASNSFNKQDYLEVLAECFHNQGMNHPDTITLLTDLAHNCYKKAKTQSDFVEPALLYFILLQNKLDGSHINNFIISLQQILMSRGKIQTILELMENIVKKIGDSVLNEKERLKQLLETSWRLDQSRHKNYQSITQVQAQMLLVETVLSELIAIEEACVESGGSNPESVFYTATLLQYFNRMHSSLYAQL